MDTYSVWHRDHGPGVRDNLHKTWSQIAATLLAALAAALILEPVVPHAYLTLFLLATIFGGWSGRRSTGMATGLAATAMAEYFFMNPKQSLHLDAEAYGEFALFAVAAVGAGWSSGECRRRIDRMREGWEQYRILLDGVRDHAVFLLDAEGRIATWNSGAQRLKGYSTEEILGKPSSIFYTPEEVSAGKPQELLQQAANRGSVRTEGWRSRKDGTRFWASVTITALYEGNGDIKGYAKTTRDVTDLKKSNDALAAKEEELQLVVESAPDTVLMTDDRGTIVFVNERVNNMFGYKPSELLGKSVEILVPQKNREAHVEKRMGFQKQPHTRSMGMGLYLNGLRKDGTEFPVEISLSPVRAREKQRFIASVRDVTERRKAEEALETTQIQDLAQLMIRDVEGRIERWNPGMERMYGYSRSEAEGKLAQELLRTRFHGSEESIKAELLRNGRWEGEFTQWTKSGREIIVNSVLILHRDKNGNPWKILQTNTDITALKEAEEKAQRLNRALEQQNADLLRAKALIEAQTQQIAMTAKMSALGEMAGGMAHEINNPMGIIHARASDLKEIAAERATVPAELVIQTMDKIRSTASRVTTITMALRKFARDSQHDQPTATRVQDILDDTLAFCVERFRQSSVELRLRPVEPTLLLDCRAGEISQVILNLLNNAVDAVQPLPEKWVELEVRDGEGDLEIRVTDSGNGIPENIRAKIGQPFFTTKEVGRGTGLGLSISKGIVETHGGELFVDSACEHTRFVVRLRKAEERQRETAGAGR